MQGKFLSTDERFETPNPQKQAETTPTKVRTKERRPPERAPSIPLCGERV
jgi:hypothetical protein